MTWSTFLGYLFMNTATALAILTLIMNRIRLFPKNPFPGISWCHSTCTYGGFAQGAFVGGGIIDCAALAESSPCAFSGGVPLFAGVGLVPDWGNLVGGKAALVAADCLLAQGTTVPDSAPADGVPLRAHGAVVPSPGSIIAVGPLAQGAAVPTAGLGMSGDPLLVRDAARLVPATVLVALVVGWLAQGA